MFGIVCCFRTRRRRMKRNKKKNTQIMYRQWSLIASNDESMCEAKNRRIDHFLKDPSQWLALLDRYIHAHVTIPVVCFFFFVFKCFRTWFYWINNYFFFYQLPDAMALNRLFHAMTDQQSTPNMTCVILKNVCW